MQLKYCLLSSKYTSKLILVLSLDEVCVNNEGNFGVFLMFILLVLCLVLLLAIKESSFFF